MKKLLEKLHGSKKGISNMRRELEYRFSFEKLLTDASIKLINLEYEKIDSEIKKILKSFGEFVGADRCFIYLLDDQKEFIVNEYYWIREGVKPNAEPLNKISIEDVRWSYETLEKNQVISITKVEDLPLEAVRLREVMKNAGVKSFLTVPMLLKGKIVGVMNFNFVRRRLRNDQQLEFLLKIVSEIIVNALNRKKVEEEKNDLTTNLQERIKEINCVHSLMKMSNDDSVNMEELFKNLIKMIQVSWQYPELTCARIIYNDEEFKSENFEKTPWRQGSDIIINGKKCGKVEVYYLREAKIEDEGPFLKEERALIETIAQKIQTIIEKKQVITTLEEVNLMNKTLIDTIPFGMDIVDEDKNILFMSDKLKRLFGENGVGKKCWEVYKSDQTACANCPFNQSITVGETKMIEFENLKLNKTFQLYHTGMNYQGKRAALEVFVDVSENKRYEKKMLEMYKHLGVINRHISILLGVGNCDPDKDKVTDFILDSSVKLSGAEKVAIFKFSESDKLLKCLSSRGFSGTHREQISKIDIRNYQFINPVVYDGLRFQGHISDFKLHGLTIQDSLGYIILPLRVKRQVKGALLMCISDDSRISSQELSFYDAFAQQVAVNLDFIFEG